MKGTLLYSLSQELHEARRRHKHRYDGEVQTLITEVDQEYGRHLDRITSSLNSVATQTQELVPISTITRRYLYAMRWVGWGDSEFGPVLEIRPVARYSLALLAYLSARLIDDAIDRHRDYKGRAPSLFGYVAERLNDTEAARVSSMMGGFMLSSCLWRLSTDGDDELVDTLTRLYLAVVPGVLAEILAAESKEYTVYRSIVRRKAVAYDMVLHQAFFQTVEPAVKAPLLELLAEYSEAAQWLNDLVDREDDRSRRHLTVWRTLGTERLSDRIGRAFEEIWMRSQSLGSELRDAMACRLADSVETLIRWESRDA